jgi:hypothetical protein
MSQRKTILLISTLIFLSGGLLFTMEVETDYYKYYRKDSPLTKSVDFVNKSIGGQYPVMIELSGKTADSINQPAILKFLEELKKELEPVEGIDKVITWLDFLQEGHTAFANTPPAGWYKDKNKIAQVTMIVEDADKELSRYYINENHNRSLIFIRSSHISTSSFKNVIKKIEQYLEAHPQPGISTRISGTYLRTVESADHMAIGQLRGTFVAIIVIFTVVFLLIGSASLTLMAFIANILPVLGIYGLLAVLGETLNMGTTTIAAIALGIGVDDTVHFLLRFLSEAKRTKNKKEIISKAFDNAGMAILLTSISISVTFLALAGSNIKPLFQLGVFTTAAMGFCLVSDLFLLPILLDWTVQKTLQPTNNHELSNSTK